MGSVVSLPICTLALWNMLGHQLFSDSTVNIACHRERLATADILRGRKLTNAQPWPSQPELLPCGTVACGSSWCQQCATAPWEWPPAHIPSGRCQQSGQRHWRRQHRSQAHCWGLGYLSSGVIEGPQWPKPAEKMLLSWHSGNRCLEVTVQKQIN